MLSLIVFIFNYDQCMLRLDILYLTTKVLFCFFFLQTINICISNIGQLNIFQLFEFYTFIVYLRLLFTSYILIS